MGGLLGGWAGLTGGWLGPTGGWLGLTGGWLGPTGGRAAFLGGGEAIGTVPADQPELTVKPAAVGSTPSREASCQLVHQAPRKAEGAAA